MAALRETIIAFFEAAVVEDQIVLPYALLGDVYENARVLSEDYDTTGRIMKVRGLQAPSRACEELLPLREFDRRSIGCGVSRSIMRANGIAIARHEMGPQSSQLNCGARCHTGSTALGRQPCRRPLPLPKALRFAATEPRIFSDSARRSASSRRAGKT